MSRCVNPVLGGTVPLVIVADAAATPVQVAAFDTLQVVVECALQSRGRWHEGFRVFDRHEREQPLDVEVGLLGYPPGKVLYVRGCAR